MRILVFEDDRDYAERFEEDFQIAFPNSTIDLRITNRPTVENCVRDVNHKYDIVFTDFKFYGGEGAITGTDIGLGIRREFPLLPLILMTNFGSEKLSEFIHVGFDSYVDKNPPGDRHEFVRSLKKSVEVAIRNSNHRVPREFDDEQLVTVKSKLDAIEKMYIENAYGRNARTAVAEDAAAYYQKVLGKRGGSRQIITQIFKIKDPRSFSGVKQECLQILWLIKRNPNAWPLTKEKYPLMKELLLEFGM